MLLLITATMTAQTTRNKYFFGVTHASLSQSFRLVPLITENDTEMYLRFSDEVVWHFFFTRQSHIVYKSQVIAAGVSATTWGAQNKEPFTAIPFTGISIYSNYIEHKYFDPHYKLTVFDYLPRL